MRVAAKVDERTLPHVSLKGDHPQEREDVIPGIQHAKALDGEGGETPAHVSGAVIRYREVDAGEAINRRPPQCGHDLRELLAEDAYSPPIDPSEGWPRGRRVREGD